MRPRRTCQVRGRCGVSAVNSKRHESARVVKRHPCRETSRIGLTSRPKIRPATCLSSGFGLRRLTKQVDRFWAGAASGHAAALPDANTCLRQCQLCTAVCSLRSAGWHGGGRGHGTGGRGGTGRDRWDGRGWWGRMAVLAGWWNLRRRIVTERHCGPRADLPYAL